MRAFVATDTEHVLNKMRGRDVVAYLDGATIGARLGTIYIDGTASLVTEDDVVVAIVPVDSVRPMDAR